MDTLQMPCLDKYHFESDNENLFFCLFLTTFSPLWPLC